MGNFLLAVARFSFGVSLSLMSLVAMADQKADDLVKQSDESRGPQGSFSVTASIKDSQSGAVKQSVFRVFAKGSTLSLIEQMAPARLQGRKLLMRDHDLWLWTPNISRATRIGFEQKLAGEVSNGDIARTNFSEDYSAALSGEETDAGRAVYKIHLTAKNKDVTYRSIDYWVEKSNHHPVRATFYAVSGKIIKTALYSDFKNFLGKPRMSKVVIKEALQTSHISELTYANYKREDLDDARFSKESLGQ